MLRNMSWVSDLLRVVACVADLDVVSSMSTLQYVCLMSEPGADQLRRDVGL